MEKAGPASARKNMQRLSVQLACFDMSFVGNILVHVKSWHASNLTEPAAVC